jgi:signal recognition particle receptor subunit beta
MPLGSNKYRSKNDTSLQDVEKNPTFYKMIDTPGHGKLRLEQSLSHLQNPAIRGIIFVVDSSMLDNSDAAVLRDTASYLHDVLLALQQRVTGAGSTKAKSEIPVLVAANKQDLFTALPAGAVKDRLQTEIERVRNSRTRGLTAAGKEGFAEDEEVLGGGGEEKFNFKMMEEYQIEIDVVGGAVRGEEAGKGVRKWEEWIGSLL